MIQRFLTSLHALDTLAPGDLASARGRLLIADCADAVRLELDCPQQDFTPAQRAVLRRLGDVLEAPDAAGDGVRRAVRDAHDALGRDV